MSDATWQRDDLDGRLTAAGETIRLLAAENRRLRVSLAQALAQIDAALTLLDRPSSGE